MTTTVETPVPGAAPARTAVVYRPESAVFWLYIAAVVSCAPPQNKPLPTERDACLPYLVRELGLLAELRVILALGAYAWDGVLRALAAGLRPHFGHLAEARVDRFTVLGSYHPSQQNTFTGRLTPEMLDRAVLRARDLAGLDPP